ncbi:MAG: hypothetical protein WKF37_08165 [Bryobacteraceae bacterium]
MKLAGHSGVHNRENLMTREIAASIGGVAATVPMTAVMMGLHNFLQEPEALPPQQIGERVAELPGLPGTPIRKKGWL